MPPQPRAGFAGWARESFAWRREATAEVGCRVITVARSHEPLRSQGFLTITPEFSFADCPAAEIIVIPGAGIR